MSQALQTTKPNTDVIARITEFQSVAKVFSESGLFTDVKGQSQCFVKIMAGAELGIPPFTAMNSFHIIKGKVTMTANTIAARVKASGRYNFRVIEKSAERCVIEFSEDGKPVYTETWDAKRARMAGTQNMDKFPDAMLFARCVTSGARAVCPDVVGQFYTPEEMGAKVNEDGEIIQGESRQVETAVTTTTTEPAIEKAKELGGVVVPQIDALIDQFGALPSEFDGRKNSLRQLKADINVHARRFGIAIFESKSGESMGDAEKRMGQMLKLLDFRQILDHVNAELATAGLLDVLADTKADVGDDIKTLEAKTIRAEEALDAAKLPA